MVPPPDWTTPQVTAVFDVPVTVGVNWTVPEEDTDEEEGATVTTTTGLTVINDVPEMFGSAWLVARAVTGLVAEIPVGAE
jgi:hypothetical protein